MPIRAYLLRALLAAFALTLGWVFLSLLLGSTPARAAELPPSSPDATLPSMDGVHEVALVAEPVVAVPVPAPLAEAGSGSTAASALRAVIDTLPASVPELVDARSVPVPELAEALPATVPELVGALPAPVPELVGALPAPVPELIGDLTSTVGLLTPPGVRADGQVVLVDELAAGERRAPAGLAQTFASAGIVELAAAGGKAGGGRFAGTAATAVVPVPPAAIPAGDRGDDRAPQPDEPGTAPTNGGDPHSSPCAVVEVRGDGTYAATGTNAGASVNTPAFPGDDPPSTPD